MDPEKSLHAFKLLRTKALIHRIHCLIHVAILSPILLIYRPSSFRNHPINTILFLSELFMSFLWLLNQSFNFRPLSRSVYPENLPSDAHLPAIDVFVCTADPKKEPPLDVVNTVISALSMDYPSNKFAVYLSDDGESRRTFYTLLKGWEFARDWWIPFCRDHHILCRSPQAYFSTYPLPSDSESELIKVKYEEYKAQVAKGEDISTLYGRPPTVEVINYDQPNMPLLVYLSREKKPSHPHHFKAGALNVLLRVSGLISNAPYILCLDCDMYSNDPSSARQAMCFHLDPKISKNLAFVQFPQVFHNISKNDIYGASLRTFFKLKLSGMDGLRGPILSGTGFYIKREVLLFGNLTHEVKDVSQLKNSFGLSNDYVISLHQGHHRRIIENTLQREIEALVSCDYEKDTLWGQQIGFLYHSVVEDYFTGFNLHCMGFTSIFCNPSRPSFLGNGTTNLNDVLVQDTRWTTGLVEVGLSKFCPLIYGTPKMSLLQSMCYAHLALYSLCCVPMLCLAVLPQLCLFYGVPVYPEVSSSWFLLYLAVFVSCLLQHIRQVISTGDSIQMWWNELRIWMIKSVSSNFLGNLNLVLKWIGLKESTFVLTSKIEDKEKNKMYHNDTFDFRVSNKLLVPIVTLLILNMVALLGGVLRVVYGFENWEVLFGQFILTFFILVAGYPVSEGMILRKDKGSVSLIVILSSTLYCVVLLYLGYVAFV